MSTLPVSSEHDVTIQNNTTGAVDYLQFTGTTLTSSAMFNYGIAGMNIVASDVLGPAGDFNLVAQNPTTGVVDFLGINPMTGNLVSSVMGNVSLPRIIGTGFFGTTGAPGQTGEELVSQLANGELDFLAFNPTGHLIASDLVANSVGLPQAVGVAVGAMQRPPFSGNGSTTSENVITQLANGSLDAIGFSGNFGAGSLSVSATLMLPGSAGTAPVGAVNQDALENENIADASGTQGVQIVSQLPSGQLDLQSFDSGYSDSSHDGLLYASNLLAPSFPGFHAVDGGLINNQLFPIS